MHNLVSKVSAHVQETRPAVTIEQLALTSYRLYSRLQYPIPAESEKAGQAMDVDEVAKEVIALRTELSRRPCTAMKVTDYQKHHYITDHIYNNANPDDVLVPETAAE